MAVILILFTTSAILTNIAIAEVTCKLHKRDPDTDDLRECQDSISFTVQIVEPRAVSDNIIAETGESTSDLSGIVIDYTEDGPGNLGQLAVDQLSLSVGESFTGLSIEQTRLAVKNLELAPWPQLLGKVEKFNRLVTGMTEVSLIRQAMFIYL